MITRRALSVAAVIAILALAAGVGHLVAGPAGAPVVLPAPPCPATLGEARPGTGPSSTMLVPYGPVSGAVCVYRTPAGGDPAVAPPAGRDPLDPTAAAELAGLLHPLRPTEEFCGFVLGEGRTPPIAATAVVLLRYRPGTVPTVGDELRLWMTGAPCPLAGNGMRTVAVDPATADRLVGTAPVLRQVFPKD